MSHIMHNEILPELAGSAAQNPYARNTAAARLQMLGGHASQALVPARPDTRYHLTGFEHELGTTTFAIKMPVDGEVIQIIEKYPRSPIYGNRINPITLLIYENVETKEIDVVEIKTWHCLHQHFGFPYKPNPKISVHRGQRIPAGTVFADTPAKDELGNAQLGTEANVAYMSIPGVIEDGVVISESYARRIGIYGYEKREISFGSNAYPLNLYGDELNYRIFPDIGEQIRPDGLLFGTRPYDEWLDIIGMSPKAVRRPDMEFDTLRYAVPNARVIDVSIIHEPRGNDVLTPPKMASQAREYYQYERAFNEALLKTYEELKRIRRDTLRMSHRLQNMIEEASRYVHDKYRANVKRMYQHQPLDEWRVEVTFEYIQIPTVPFKVTNLHGGKGVICAVWKDEDMPIDAEGNRADIIMDGDSIVKRMNVGALYEQYVNATSRTVANTLRAWLGGPSQAEMNNVRDGLASFEVHGQYMDKVAVQKAMLAKMAIEGQETELLARCWSHLLRYYEIISPRMYDKLKSVGRARQVSLITSVVTDFCRIWFPTDNPIYLPAAIELLRREYPVVKGPVRYCGDSRVPVTTVSDVLIGSVYFVTLEKTGGDYSAVASAKTQHIGILACLNKHDKHASAVRNNAVRLGGESEIRSMVSFVSPRKTADLVDQSNNPRAHRTVIDTILRAPNPSKLAVAVDRALVPLGDSRILEYVNESLFCAGIEFFVPDRFDPAPEVYRPTDLDGGLEEEDLRVVAESDADTDDEVGDDDERPRKSNDDEEEEPEETED